VVDWRVGLEIDRVEAQCLASRAYIIAWYVGPDALQTWSVIVKYGYPVIAEHTVPMLIGKARRR
jgi:hypothetical protein